MMILTLEGSNIIGPDKSCHSILYSIIL